MGTKDRRLNYRARQLGNSPPFRTKLRSLALTLSPERQGYSNELRQQSMLEPPEIEVSTATDMELLELDHSVPSWLLWGLAAITVALGLVLYYSY